MLKLTEYGIKLTRLPTSIVPIHRYMHKCTYTSVVAPTFTEGRGQVNRRGGAGGQRGRGILNFVAWIVANYMYKRALEAKLC